MLLPIVVDALRQRTNVAGVVVERVDEPQRRHATCGSKIGVHRIERRRGRARRVLRIQRQDKNLFAVDGAKLVERRGNRRLSVPHAELDRTQVRRQAFLLEPLSQIAVQQHLLLDAVHEQRRPVVGPDRRIFRSRPRGPHAQHHAVQQRLPCDVRNLHDARIRQEFTEVAPHRLEIGAIGRAEIDQHDADLACPLARLCRRMARRQRVGRFRGFRGKGPGNSPDTART